DAGDVRRADDARGAAQSLAAARRPICALPACGAHLLRVLDDSVGGQGVDRARQSAGSARAVVGAPRRHRARAALHLPAACDCALALSRRSAECGARMNALDRYLVRTILGAVGMWSLLLLALGALFLFIGQQDDIGVGSYTAKDAILFVLLNLPEQAWQLL